VNTEIDVQIQSKEIEIVPIGELDFHPKNMNKHSEDQINRLCKLIKYQGFRNPLVVQKGTNLVVAGNGRLMAARKLNIERVPVTYQEFESEAQLYAYMASDNAIASWSELDLSAINNEALGFEDFDVELLGLKDFSLEEVKVIEPLTDEDAVPENVETRCKLGDIWKLGNHRLMCGDSTSIDAVQKLMNGEKADMVFTDPPYGVSVVKSGMVGADFGVAKKGIYSEVIGDETTDTAKEFYQACVAAGLEKFIIWGGNYFTDFLEPSKSWVVWNKRGDTNIENTFADGEMAWSNLGHPVRIHGQLWNGMIRAGEKDKRVHPTQKPIALAEYCFELLKDSKKIFDGFGGSGSTLIACEKTNRKCFMMELDPHYCDVILRRWEDYTGKKAELT
jgi:DNA modification methylase